jgi:hypothetical protein
MHTDTKVECGLQPALSCQHEQNVQPVWNNAKLPEMKSSVRKTTAVSIEKPPKGGVSVGAQSVDI